MSDVMFFGRLRAPVVSGDVVGVMQLRSAAAEAADRLEKMEIEMARLRAASGTFEGVAEDLADENIRLTRQNEILAGRAAELEEVVNGSFVFGDETLEVQLIESAGACPACGGSGHIDDARNFLERINWFLQVFNMPSEAAHPYSDSAYSELRESFLAALADLHKLAE